MYNNKMSDGLFNADNDYQIIDISAEEESIKNMLSYNNSSIKEYEKSFVHAQNDESSVRKIYYNARFLLSLISDLIQFINNVIVENSQQAKKIILLQKRINRLIDDHNISKTKKNNDNMSKDFELFFNSFIRKESEAPEVTFQRVYKIYSTWYGNLADASGKRLKSDDFKKLLEEKLNISNIGKNVRGIQLFSSEEEAEDFDKNNT
jgi:hypothetical protein